MDTMSAFMLGQANQGSELKVFDWTKAVALIKEHKATEAEAGLSEDWEWTGGVILTGGKPVKQEDTYTFLASTWATPVLRIAGEEYDCYSMQKETPGWGADTFWPEEAILALNN